MKNLEKSNLKLLNREELKSIKGGVTCQEALGFCSKYCGNYSAFAQCIDDLQPWPCSPLAGYPTVCPQ